MLVAIIVIIDQLIKYFIYMNKPQIPVIPGVINITYAQNTGTLFGLAQGSNTFFIISSIIIIAFIVIITMKMKKYSSRRKVWKLILGGGISNLIDRIFRGFVIDYVELKIFGVCNLADFCIVIGVIGFIIVELKEIFSENKEPI